MKSLIIDAGHGGTDSGASAFQTREKDWNLKMSLYQYKRLKDLGADVALTRSTDETLPAMKRVERIKSRYDYCISNHFNAFNGTARGIETIHSIYADEKLASDIAQSLHQATGLPLRRVFTRKNAKGKDWYFMHRLTGRTETVIVEYGFLDNTEDFKFYQSEKNFYKAAEAVVKVLCGYLGVDYKAPGSEEDLSDKSQTLYRVQVGAFSKKENAEQQVAQLKQAGFDAFITR